VAVLAVLCVALLLRLWGLGQGYPEFYGHVDEIGVAASIWNFFREGTFEPTEFTYPALYPYLVAAGIWCSAVLGFVDLPTGGDLLERIAFTSYINPGWSALYRPRAQHCLHGCVPNRRFRCCNSLDRAFREV
jgi:hypothetical protein